MSEQHPEQEPEELSQETDEEEIEAEIDTEDTAVSLIQDLQAQVMDLEDRLKRAFAEQQNQRQRMLKEKANADRYGAARLATDLLDVLDNLERALNAVPMSLQDNEPIQNVLTGVSMVQEQLLQVFNTHSIRKLEPVGQALDSNFHETIAEADDQEAPAGTIIDVAQSGYVMHDRLLRPAKVIISSGRGGETSKEAPHVDQQV